MSPLLLLFFLPSSLILMPIDGAKEETRVLGVSRSKRLNPTTTNEEKLLNQVAELMSRVREKDVGQKLNESGEHVDGTDIPVFSVFPETQHFNRLHVRVHREPVGFLWRKLYLEDFHGFNNVWPQFKTTSIELNTTTLQEANVNPVDFYSQVARNLKSTLPNLNQIKLGGGYRFESDITTSDDLIDKMAGTKENIVQMIKALKDQNLNVTFDAYSIELILPAQVVERLGDDVFRQQLGQIYQPVCLKWADNVYNLKFLSNEVVIRLTVSLGSRLPKRVFSPSCINQTDPLESNFDRVSSRYNVSQDDEDSLQHQNHSYFEKECLKQVFEQNKTELQAMDSLYLEDFVDSSTFQIQEKLERLNLSVSVAYSPVYTHEEFYSRAVKGLKRTAPNLKTVGLYGTLRMYPRIMSLYELRKEVMEIKRSIEAMSRSMHEVFETVEWKEEPTFIFAVDKEVLKRVQASDLIKAVEVFNYSELELSTGKISLEFSTETGVKHRLNILITALHPKGISFDNDI